MTFASNSGSDQEENISDTPSISPATVQPLGCTLRAYAGRKRLPEAFLKELGLSERKYQGAPAVRVPYLDASGSEAAVRFRTALEKGKEGDQRFRWMRGSKPLLYGLWRLRPEASVVVVEGESDCHTLWLHGINAVGSPGASSWNEDRDAPHLACFETIYVVVEPDQGGEATLQWIRKSALRDRIRIVRLQSFKDPSDLHIDAPEFFQERWRAALDAAALWTSEEAQKQDAARHEAWAKCQDLARSRDILARFASDLYRAGVVGVEREAKLLFLAVTSRVFDRPISVAVKGPSSAGKSYLVEKVLSFFPPEAYYAVTAMSERALAYGDEPLKHRMLVLYEAEGMSGDTASYLIRSLLSEGCVRYETVEKTPQGLQGRLIEREGPTGLIVTTTRNGLHPENETRLISLTLADGQDQTRAILAALADEDRRDEVDREVWRALQHWLATSDVRVVVPFASTLVSLIPPVSVRLRRDAKLLLNLIRTHALLHQASRERDEGGRVVAVLEDYGAVYDLVAEQVAEAVQASVPARVRQTIDAVAHIAAQSGSATVQAVAQALKLDKSSASRRCRTAENLGYIRNDEASKGRPARFLLADPVPDERPVLPRPAVLASTLVGNPPTQANGCTVAGETEGYDTFYSQERRSDRRRVVL